MQSFTSYVLIIALSIVSMQAQNFNNEVAVEGKSPVLLGKINQEALSSNSYGTWFQSNHDTFTPDANTVNQLKNELPEYTITAFMGTWCGDSKREVPKFYKVLEEANYPMDRLTMVGLSRDRDTYKQSPGGEEEGLDIHRVPTFIVYKDGKEVNRIVESPVTSIERDLLQIVQGNYQSNYQSISMTAAAMDEMGLDKFLKKTKKLKKKIQPFAKSVGELNTYILTLFYAGKVEESLAIAAFNTSLFPTEARGYVTMANLKARNNQTEEARKAYEKALEIDPENKRALEGMNALNSL